jgi:hypothetical protein
MTLLLITLLILAVAVSGSLVSDGVLEETHRIQYANEML